ncbi:unnamed protein product [Phytophthora fragariaefolia]|uniref:Unnamed protein product n=1 Tax=Phytophthora fragariaefolia TaxID=1490495 RepID=A0A9W6WTB8_9STRA|nr:unnamed protein product [Phytophthora fragariaefolia]
MSTKRSCPSPPSSPAAPTVKTSLLDAFELRGWVCMRNLLSPSELHVLRDECDALYARQSAEAVAAQGCVLDVMAQCPLKSNVDDQQVFTTLLFEKLPTIVGQLMAKCTKVVFFSEHYVVKPPKSHVEFRWHRDDDEQLAMCVHRETIAPYISAWCALDDVTEVNGALQFVSLGGPDEDSTENMQHRASEPENAEAGDVLFFLSNVWHCSSSNESDVPRRAFYAQYSRERITAQPRDTSPLSFAIQCSPRTSALSVKNDCRIWSNNNNKKLKTSSCEPAE